MKKSLPSLTPEEVAQKILKGFNQHYENIKQASVNAKKYFEQCNWELIDKESKLRLSFYDNQVNKYSQELNKSILAKDVDPTFWIKVKRYYVHLISIHKQPELAETFFNSIFCNLFERNFYNNKYIFTKPCVSTNYIDMDDPVVSSYIVRDNLKDTFRKILEEQNFSCKFENLERDINRLEEQFYKNFNYVKSIIFEIQIIKYLFIRGKGAYIVAKIVTGSYIDKSVLIALLNDKEKGIFVDSLISRFKNISSIFSFSRSYFFIYTEYPSAIVEYLRKILPNKTRADLYSIIGLHKHGKTLLYRHFLKYSNITKEKLVTAPGIKGMVMSVFTFPMFPFVFKMINDKFIPPKTGNAQMVKEKYYFVKNHVRIGRLADTWEFSDVCFPIEDIEESLFKELQEKAPSNIEIDKDENLLIIKHVYMENKMKPLNVYLENATDEQKKEVIQDYGRAIDDLINSNIFPGDMLTKNFGVTKQKRVVFYDYDEITLMNKVNFRKIPEARNIEEEMSSDPWYYVAHNDIFPEEFNYFMFADKDMQEIFNKDYKKLLDVKYWQKVQQKITKAKVIDYYPYGSENRMCNIYGDINE